MPRDSADTERRATTTPERGTGARGNWSVSPDTITTRPHYLSQQQTAELLGSEIHPGRVTWVVTYPGSMISETPRYEVVTVDSREDVTAAD